MVEQTLSATRTQRRFERVDFFWQKSNFRYWAKPLDEVPLLKRCYFTGARDPIWQLYRHDKNGWRHWCFASDAAIEKLRETHLRKEQNEMARAQTQRTQELEAKLDEILADLSQVNPLNLNTIKCIGGFSASFLSGKGEVVQRRRDKVFAAFAAERKRRNALEAELRPNFGEPTTREQQEAMIHAAHPELAPAEQPTDIVTAMEEELELLRQQNEALQTRCEALQQANEQLAEQPAYPAPTEAIDGLKAQLQHRRDALQGELEAIEAELRLCDRLAQRLQPQKLRVAS